MRVPGLGVNRPRPVVIWAFTAWCSLAPVFQAASLAGLTLLNFGPDRVWNYVAYGLGAPYVAWLVWRGHPRARFTAYIFLTHEAIRGLALSRWDAVAWAVSWVALLQLPAARQYLPSLKPGAVTRPRIR